MSTKTLHTPKIKQHRGYSLSFQNMKQRPFRSTTLILLVTFFAFALFSGSVLVFSLQNGLESLQNRFGADIIVVPISNDADMEAILLNGEPSYFYMDKDALETVSSLDGISQISYQVYLTSTGSDCCELEIQLIGFDPETDFTIQPWIAETYGGSLTDGAIVVGSDITVKNGTSLTFFGREYTVAAQLAETGTGLDQSVYANLDTLLDLMEASEEKGFHFLDGVDPENSISSILINVEDEADINEVATSIRGALDGVQVITTQSFIQSIVESIDSISTLLLLFLGSYLVLSFIMLTLTFSITANERKKEFAILRILGETQKGLGKLLLKESLWISFFGSLIGLGFGILFVFPFQTAIQNRLDLPYLMPSLPVLGSIFLVSFALTLLSGPLAASFWAYRISKVDVSLILRKEN